MNITIKTNRNWHELVCWLDLTPGERKEFDYLDDFDKAVSRFVRYRGWVYDVEEFETVSRRLSCELAEAFRGWDAFQSDSYFSGIVLKFNEHSDQVQVGTYFS